MRTRTPLVTLVVCALVACSATDERATESASAVERGLRLPCDVDAIFARSCRGCHASPPVFGAPMALEGYADLHAAAHSDPTKKVYERVQTRVASDVRPMPPSPNPRLTSDQIAVLDRWIAAGAPAAGGSSTSCGDGGTTDPTSLSCNVNLHMAPASKWAMPETSDDVYVCYGFDVTSSEKRHVIGIAPRIDNRNIVHHLLLFQADRSVSSTPTPCSAATPRAWRTVYGWAPGGGNFEFPAAAGYPQEQTTHYVMQVHYNNVLHRPDQKDGSGFDFCTTNELRPNDADMLAFGAMNFDLPPRATTDVTCDAKMPASLPQLHLFAAFPHMHQIGTSILTTKPGTSGSADQWLGGQTSWDFQNQVYMPIDGVIRGGDTVRTRCVWKNNTDATVSFGERTEDEMCFSFTMYWPRIEAPGWSYLTPSLLSRCRPTP